MQPKPSTLPKSDRDGAACRTTSSSQRQRCTVRRHPIRAGAAVHTSERSAGGGADAQRSHADIRPQATRAKGLARTAAHMQAVFNSSVEHWKSPKADNAVASSFSLAWSNSPAVGRAQHRRASNAHRATSIATATKMHFAPGPAQELLVHAFVAKLRGPPDPNRKPTISHDVSCACLSK